VTSRRRDWRSRGSSVLRTVSSSRRDDLRMEDGLPVLVASAPRRAGKPWRASQQGRSRDDAHPGGSSPGAMLVASAPRTAGLGREAAPSLQHQLWTLSGTAGNALTTGHDNSFFGSVRVIPPPPATNNAFFGRSAGWSNVSGSNNAFFGALAGSSSTGSDNSFFGYGAARSPHHCLTPSSVTSPARKTPRAEPTPSSAPGRVTPTSVAITTPSSGTMRGWQTRRPQQLFFGSQPESTLHRAWTTRSSAGTRVF